MTTPDYPSISGIELSDLDSSFRPNDDLYRHVNEKWLRANPVPADRARFGSFSLLADEAELAVKSIIQESAKAAKGSEERKVGDLYQSFMDEEVIEKLGWAPISAYLAEVEATRSVTEFLELLGKYQRLGIAALLQIFVDNDPGNPEVYRVFFEQSGIGLPDESYYREESFAEIREKYQIHLTKVLELAGVDQAKTAAEQVYELEQKIAARHWDKVKNRDSQATYNLIDWAELTADSSSWLLSWAKGIGTSTESLEKVVVRQPSFIQELAELLSEENLSSWKSWLSWQLIHSHSPYLHNEAVEANFDFYGRTLTGTPKIRPRWKRAVSLVEGSLGDAVGKIYTEKYFPQAAKEKMELLISNLIEAYRQSISELDWMGPETRQRALEKLEKFNPKIGAPKQWKDYSSIEITESDLIANLAAVNEWEFNRELGKIGKAIDREEWFMLPQTVNAYYNPGFNEIVFPAAILQEPFFNPDWDPAVNYGAIGAVIGHEIGHGFDDQGSRFDGDGKLEDWWTESDRKAFEERTKNLIDQYSALAPSQTPDSFVNGELTIGENIGDLGGLGIAWKAYLLSLNGQEAPVIDSLTAAQRFLISWARIWRQSYRDEEVKRLLAIDPHSPNEFRTNQIVRNLEIFYQAFGVTESDELWLDPAERVQIW